MDEVARVFPLSHNRRLVGMTVRAPDTPGYTYLLFKCTVKDSKYEVRSITVRVPCEYELKFYIECWSGGALSEHVWGVSDDWRTQSRAAESWDCSCGKRKWLTLCIHISPFFNPPTPLSGLWESTLLWETEECCKQNISTHVVICTVILIYYMILQRGVDVYDELILNRCLYENLEPPDLDLVRVS